MSGLSDPRLLADRRALSPTSRRSVCSQCNTLNEIGARHCLKCGALLYRPMGVACPACRANNLLGESYCDVCGSALPPTPYLIVLDTGLRLRAFDANPEEAVLGRLDPMSGLAPDVNLEPFAGNLGGLSRRHTRLLIRDNQFWVEDLHSVNFTYLNNQKVEPEQPQRLKDGDVLRLGNFTIVFRAG